MSRSLLPDFVIKEGMINSCLTRNADFEVFTNALKVDENAPPGEYVISMVGSSTVRDLQGDIMAMSALDDMTRAPKDLLCFLNHQYNLPEDLLGSLHGTPWIKSASGLADLHLSVDVEMSNPRAAQSYNMVAKGRRRLGCSIGCLVLDYEYNDDDTLVILHIQVLEWSLVGIPASQRCWVETATKSLFERSLMEGNADKALQLAPAVRGMYWRSYDSIVKHVTSDGLRRDLERVTPRNTAPHRIMQVFNDGETGFALADTKGITKSLKRDEVSTLLEKTQKQERTPVHLEEDDLLITDDTWELTAKSVSGKTSWPLADIGTAWDGSKATSQIFDYARDENGDIVASKAKQCFLYFDPDKSDTQAGFKMPFCYVSGGSPKIVPLGVQKAAGVLNGSMGGVSASDADKAGMRAKCETMYGRINSQFHPDPEWVVPWKKDESKSIKEIADSNTDSALNRQDIGEEASMPKGKKKADDVEVSADGKHEPFTGTHSHAHKAFGAQGDDDQHSHSHSHDGDANHDHSHDDASDAEKGLEPDITKSSSDTAVPEENAQIATTEPNSDTLTKEMDAPASETPDNTLTVKAAAPEETALPETDQRLVLLRAMAVQMGLDETVVAPVPMAKSMAISQDVISLISSIDSTADELDEMIDNLMACFGIPDIDDDDTDSTADPGYTRYSLEHRLERSLAGILRQKEGRAISEKNKGNLQQIHDIVKAMHGGVCDGVQSRTVDEATDEAREQGEGQPIQEQYSLSLETSIKSLDGLTKALADNLTIKSIVQGEVNAALEEAKQQLEAERKKLLALNNDQQTLMRNIQLLKEMPLGRPTTLAGRTVIQEEGTTTYQELLTAGVKPLDSLTEDDLEVVTVNGIKHKRWPAGYRIGQRPPLTEYAKTYMSPMDYYPYEQGNTKDVLVPFLEETARV